LQRWDAVSQLPVCPPSDGHSLLSQQPSGGTQIMVAAHFFIEPHAKSHDPLVQTGAPPEGAVHFTHVAPH